jgi:hypothetical protein
MAEFAAFGVADGTRVNLDSIMISHFGTKALALHRVAQLFKRACAGEKELEFLKIL